MNCEQFTERLDEILDGTVTVAEACEAEEHAADCEACRGELEAYRQLTARAAALPRSILPEHDLWRGIAERIGERKIVPMEAPAPPARSEWRWRTAAMILVALAAGALIERALDSSGEDTPPGGRIATTASAPGASTPDATTPTASTRTPDTSTDSVPGTDLSRPTVSAPFQPPPIGSDRIDLPVQTPPIGSDRPDITVQAPPVGSDRPDISFPKTARTTEVRTEIAEIRGLLARVEEQRDALGPETVAAIEMNLAIIDNAITEIDAVLANDPNNRQLISILTLVHSRQLDILIHATHLPTQL